MLYPIELGVQVVSDIACYQGEVSNRRFEIPFNVFSGRGSWQIEAVEARQFYGDILFFYDSGGSHALTLTNTIHLAHEYGCQALYDERKFWLPGHLGCR